MIFMREVFKTLRNTGNDRRTQKTRKALSDALISLMFEKSYESIVVQDILDRANVGRSTFYTHFRDRDELLVDGLQGLRELLGNAQKAAHTSSPKNHEHVIGFSLAMFEHVYSHTKLYRALVGGPGWAIVRQHLEDMLVQLMKEEAQTMTKKKASAEIRFELLLHFLGATFMSILTWWFNHKNSLSPKEIDILFRELVIPTLAANLN